MKFLQLNLGRGKEAQNLLMQSAKGRGADVLLISKQHKWSENSGGTRIHHGGLGSLFVAVI